MMELSTPREHFNPRSPHGERLSRRRLIVADTAISIHAPRTGSDGHDCREAVPRRISIHAPRTGSDTRKAHGIAYRVTFQSTLPARGATGTTSARHTARIFQSTLPARGATEQPKPQPKNAEFQSTLPARGATYGTGL